ncbi:hypothetical protein [Leyella stercorea]|uniref:hypothetical protein n=1 Tax=Leyella stercorea TaxID=363265 RepID=UPI00242BF1EB|nr:hypothetical protein [Leyella stercorea]
MAFRNRKFSYSCPPPQEVYDEVITTQIVDGVEVPSIVSVPNSEFTKDLPELSDYKLSDLIQAGVPLNPVNPNVLGTVEDKLNNVVDDVINNTFTSEPTNVDVDIDEVDN